jgi:hypothetical protein
MGGIGKTQLAVEYPYRYKDDYPGGVFWINAALPLEQGLAQIGGKLHPEVVDQSPNQRVRAAFQELSRRPNALLSFDNLADPGQLARPVASEAIPVNLPCSLLFTTRQYELGSFQRIEIYVLPEGPALHLLLRHESRHAIRDDPDHPERQEARSICHLLGYLPLALELAREAVSWAVAVGETDLAETAEQRLGELGQPFLALRQIEIDHLPILDRGFHPHRPDLRLSRVAVSPDGRRVVFEDGNRTVAVWDVESGTRLLSLEGQQGPVQCKALSPDGRQVACGSADNTAAVWDLQSGTRLLSLTGHRSPVRCVGFSPDGRRVVSGAGDRTVAVWDLQSGTRLLSITGHQGPVNLVAVSPDGRRVVSGADRTAAVWDLETGTRLLSLSLRYGSVISLAVSPDGRRMVSGDSNHTVAVWDLQSGRCLASLTLGGWVQSVAWHQDGRFIEAGDSGGNLYRLEYREP